MIKTQRFPPKNDKEDLADIWGQSLSKEVPIPFYQEPNKTNDVNIYTKLLKLCFPLKIFIISVIFGLSGCVLRGNHRRQAIPEQ